MFKKLAVLALPFLLSGCIWESEHSCFDRLDKQLDESEQWLKTQTEYPSDSEGYRQFRDLVNDAQWKLSQIKNNDDLNVCDFTILDLQIVKVH